MSGSDFALLANARAAIDMPGLGIKAGDLLRIVATHKALGRVTVKTAENVAHVVDAVNVERTTGRES